MMVAGGAYMEAHMLSARLSMFFHLQYYIVTLKKALISHECKAFLC